MRFALGIEYDGTDFLGWQRLNHGPSVQAAVEAALSTVAAEPIQVTCAGRTDSGVHALCQVVHFDTTALRDHRAWTLGTNGNLPATVAVRWARSVDPGFHARFSARSRRYRYTLVDRSERPALYGRFAAWERHPLDVDAMNAAAACLRGEHDFNAFRAAACQASHARREIIDFAVRREGEFVLFDVEANAFLHHMVRNIVGSLIEVGRGDRPEGWMADVLAGRNRDAAGATAPSRGLCFIGPRYPAAWGLPPEATLPGGADGQQG